MSTALAQNISTEELNARFNDLGRAYIGMSALQYTRPGGLYKFVRDAWKIVEPDQPFQPNWHIEKLCSVLEDVYHQKIKRVVINVPPGTAKSLVVNVLFPAWVWARSARKRFLFASYGAHLSTRDNVRARQVVASEWYQRRWQVMMSEDQDAKTRYNTTERGWRVATSVGGVGTGEHPNFIIIDDPTSAAQAMSDAERTRANDWFDQTISSRLGLNPAIIIIMQRLHEEDLSGHLLARSGWLHVRWPMRFEKCACETAPECDPDDNKRCPLHRADPSWTPDPWDVRTEPGELLFPSLFPEDKVRQLEIDLGEYGTAGQLQQRPSPEGGGLFKREWFAGRFVEAGPAIARRVRGWDTAATEGSGDWTAGVRIAEEFEKVLVPAAGHERSKWVTRSTGLFFVEDVQHEQLGPDGVDKLMRVTADLDKCAQREEREGGASGKSQIAARTKLLVGHDYKEITLGQNKVMRAQPFRAQCEAGNVYLVRGPWNKVYLRELCAFPTGAHDDQVDGSSAAFNTVLLEPEPRQVSATWGKKS
jgi:predicted phage terminase large subunit-like protein